MVKKIMVCFFSVCIVISLSAPVFATLDVYNFREIFDEHGSIMMLIDADTGAIIYSNKSAEEYYGYPQLIQMQIQDINTLSPEETERERRAALEEQRNFFLFKHRLANGEIRDVEVYSYPFEIEGQKLLYSIINDVTSRIELEQAVNNRNSVIFAILSISIALLLIALALLHRSRYKNRQMKLIIQESEEMFRELFGNIKIGIFLHEFNREKPVVNSLIMANNYAQQLLGFEEDKLKQMNLEDLVTEDSRGKFSEYLIEIMEKGQTADETKFVKSDKQVLDIGFRSHTFRINEKEMVLTVFQDISETLKKEKDLRMLYRAIEQSPSAVVITETDGNIQYVNNKFTEVTGFQDYEVVGQKPTLYKEDSEESMSIYQETWDAIYSGKTWEGEFTNKKKDGSIYWARSVIAPIINEKGERTNIISMHDDITERKHMEQKLLDANKELRKALDERKLLELQLIQKEKMSAIGQLAAGVAHEINNPLGYVMSNFASIKKYIRIYDEYLDVYKQHIVMENGRELDKHRTIQHIINEFEENNQMKFIREDFPDLLTDSYDGLERIKRIVQSLREFSRMETLDEYVLYDINDGIDTTLEIANNEIKYVSKVEKDLLNVPDIEAIPHQINQVLLNLLVNAAQAIKSKQLDGMGMITISTRADEDFVYVSIGDNGVGIDDDNHSQIFNPFFTTKPVGMGTGLGLSISYDIVVNKHKGEITFESTLGIGSRFIVKLPIKQ